MNLKFSVYTTIIVITLTSFEGLPEVPKESKEAKEALEILCKIIGNTFESFVLTVVDEASCLYTATNVEHEDALEMLEGAIEEFLE